MNGVIAAPEDWLLYLLTSKDLLGRMVIIPDATEASPDAFWMGESESKRIH